MSGRQLFLKDVAAATDLSYASLRAMRTRGELPEPDGFAVAKAGGKRRPWWFDSTIVAWRAERRRWIRSGRDSGAGPFGDSTPKPT